MTPESWRTTTRWIRVVSTESGRRRDPGQGAVGVWQWAPWRSPFPSAVSCSKSRRWLRCSVNQNCSRSNRSRWKNSRKCRKTHRRKCGRWRWRLEIRKFLHFLCTIYDRNDDSEDIELKCDNFLIEQKLKREWNVIVIPGCRSRWYLSEPLAKFLYVCTCVL